MDAAAPVARIDQIGEFETLPEHGAGSAEAALQRRKGTDLAAAEQGATQAQDLVAAAVGIGPQPLSVFGGEAVAFETEADVPLTAAGAQLLQDDTAVGAAVFGIVAAGLDLDFLDGLVDQGHGAGAGDWIAHIGAFDEIADLVAA